MCWFKICLSHQQSPLRLRLYSYSALLANIWVKAHLRWQLKSRACVLHLGLSGLRALAPGHLLLTPLLQGFSTEGLAGHVQSLRLMQQDSWGSICHCPKPSFSERRRNFKKSEEVIAIVTLPSFTQQSLLSPVCAVLAWGQAFSNYRGSCLTFLLLPLFLWGLWFAMHLLHCASRPSPHGAETWTCLFFQWHLPCSAHWPQLLFPFIPKEGQCLSPLTSAFIVSRPPAASAVGVGRYGFGQGTLPCIEWWRWKEMPDSDSCLFLQLSVEPCRPEWALNSSALENNVWHTGEALSFWRKSC